jgi:hypothetical protein
LKIHFVIPAEVAAAHSKSMLFARSLANIDLNQYTLLYLYVHSFIVGLAFDADARAQEKFYRKRQI